MKIQLSLVCSCPVYLQLSVQQTKETLLLQMEDSQLTLDFGCSQARPCAKWDLGHVTIYNNQTPAGSKLWTWSEKWQQSTKYVYCLLQAALILRRQPKSLNKRTKKGEKEKYDKIKSCLNHNFH